MACSGVKLIQRIMLLVILFAAAIITFFVVRAAVTTPVKTYASSASSASAGSASTEPLYFKLEQRFDGEPEKIAETLRDLAAMLQTAADTRADWTKSSESKKLLSGIAYTQLLTQISNSLAGTFSRAETAFEHAAAAPTPEPLVIAYADLLGDLALAYSEIDGVQVEPRFQGSHAAYRRFISSIHKQIAAWPQQFRDAVPSVDSDSFALTLTASADPAPFERALAQECPG